MSFERVEGPAGRCIEIGRFGRFLEVSNSDADHDDVDFGNEIFQMGTNSQWHELRRICCRLDDITSITQDMSKHTEITISLKSGATFLLRCASPRDEVFAAIRAQLVQHEEGKD